MMLQNGRICYDMIIFQISNVSGQWLLRYECLSVCLSLDTETVNYDHYLWLGGALNFEFSLKKKENIYIQLGGPLKLFTSSKGYLSNTPEQPFKSEP